MDVCHINATLNPRSLLLPPCPALSRLDNPWHAVCSSPPQFCSAAPAATLAGVVSPLLCVGFTVQVPRSRNGANNPSGCDVQVRHNVQALCAVS